MFKQNTIRRLVAMVLTIIMVMSIVPMAAFAENSALSISASGEIISTTLTEGKTTQEKEQSVEEETTQKVEQSAEGEMPKADAIGEIIAFAPLDEEITTQAVLVGASITDVNFPTTLSATVRTATSTDVQEGEAEQVYTTEEKVIPVTWDCATAFDGNQTGVYTFTPVTTDYTVSAVFPQITIGVIHGIQNYSTSTVTISQSQTISTIQTNITSAIDANPDGIIAIIGSKTDATSALTLDIPAGVTARWEAEYSATVSGAGEIATIVVINDGTFEVAENGLVKNTAGSGRGILIINNAHIIVSGGEVSATTGSAIDTMGENTPNAKVSVIGGLVYNNGNENSPAIYMYTDDNTFESVIVSGTGKVEARGNIVIAISAHYGIVSVTGTGSVIAQGASSKAIESRNVSISGEGSVEAQAHNSHAIYNSDNISVSDSVVVSATTGNAIHRGGAGPSIITISGGEISSGTGSAIVISSASSTVTVSGGLVYSDGSSGKPVINMSNPDANIENVIINGTGRVETRTSNRYAVQSYGDITVADSAVVSAAAGRAIYAQGSSSTVTVTSGEIANTSGYALVSDGATVNISGDKVSTVSGTGRVEVTGSGNSAIASGGNISVSDAAVVSVAADTFQAIRGGGASIISVTGGEVSAATVHAIYTTGATVNISGGFVFAHGSAVSGSGNVIYLQNSNATLDIIGTGAVVAWNKGAGNTIYDAGAMNDIIKSSSNPTVYWSKSGGVSGIYYKNGANTGFIPVTDATVSIITPVSSNLVYAIPTGHIYTGISQGIGEVKLNENPMTNSTTGGEITVYYDGNTIVPKDAGTYAVTADISSGTDYEALTGISLGNYTIARAPLTITGGTVASKTYDDTITADVTAVTFGGLQNSETPILDMDYTVSATFDDANAGISKTVTGTVLLVANGSIAQNYTLANGSMNLSNQTITRATAVNIVIDIPTTITKTAYEARNTTTVEDIFCQHPWYSLQQTPE